MKELEGGEHFRRIQAVPGALESDREHVSSDHIPGADPPDTLGLAGIHLRGVVAASDARRKNGLLTRAPPGPGIPLKHGGLAILADGEDGSLVTLRRVIPAPLILSVIAPPAMAITWRFRK